METESYYERSEEIRHKLMEFILNALFGKGERESWMLKQIAGVTDSWYKEISTNRNKLYSYLNVLTLEDLTYWKKIVSCSFDTGTLEYK